VSELDQLRITIPEDRDLLHLWLSETQLAGGPPWYHPGWFSEVRRWVDDQLRRLSLSATGPLEQLRSWERSSISRIPIGDGWIYFKTVPPVFAHEFPLLAVLADWLPSSASALLAYDQQRHWSLTSDFDDVTLDHLTDLSRWEDALTNYAALQCACVARREQLLALGCPDRPFAVLHEGLTTLLNDADAILLGETGGLTEAEVILLTALTTKIATACSDLSAFGIPATLEHGDLWAGNIIAREDGDYAYFDWSDCTVTHPFFSLPLFLDTAVAAFPNDPHVRVRLCDAYLRPWSSIVSSNDVRIAFELAQRLAPLHHALTYHQRILPAMHARWEMARMIPYYLRLLLSSWDNN
jgi:hypothetical protein